MPTPSAAAAQSPAPAATGMPATSPRSRGTRARAAARKRNVERREHFLRPAPPGDVEEQRPRRVGDVCRPLTGEPEPHVVLRQADPGDLRERRRLVAAQPEELRCREPGQRAIPRQLDQAIDSDQGFDLGALFARCAGRSRESRDGAHAPPRRAPRARASARKARSRRRRGPPRPPPAQPRRRATSPPGPAPTSQAAESTADRSAPRERALLPPVATATAFTPVVPTSSPTQTDMVYAPSAAYTSS